jgi:alanine racemase
MGYGDGVPRSANGAQVAIGGKLYDVVGRVAMDQFVVDLCSSESEDLVGEEVILFGPGEDVPGSEDWAAAAGTINYEIVTRVSPRVPRVYVGQDLETGAAAGMEASVDFTGNSDSANYNTANHNSGNYDGGASAVADGSNGAGDRE